MRQRQIAVTEEAPDFKHAMFKALDIIEREQLVNPSIAILPLEHCPCPRHNVDDCEYHVQVSGVFWDDIEDS